MYRLLIIGLTIYFVACDSSKNKNTTWITREGQQDSLFQNLLSLTESATIPADSVAFLVVPVQASCPSCRKKTIDSFVKHQQSLLPGHYVILSGSGGQKLMSSYFEEREATMPRMPGLLFIDSTNQAHHYDLFENNPAFYYAVDRKVYKRIYALPTTVKQDLQEFFSGSRSE